MKSKYEYVATWRQLKQEQKPIFDMLKKYAERKRKLKTEDSHDDTAFA